MQRCYHREYVKGYPKHTTPTNYDEYSPAESADRLIPEILDSFKWNFLKSAENYFGMMETLEDNIRLLFEIVERQNSTIVDLRNEIEELKGRMRDA